VLRGPTFKVTTGVLVLAPALACGAPSAKLATGPAAEAVLKGVASGTRSFDHQAWHELLARHVDGQGRVDYAGFRKDRPALQAYLSALSRADLATLARGELLALLINAYNACTVRLVLDGASAEALPRSIRDLKDPWDRKTCGLAAETLSLNTLEHGMIRAIFKDSRIHAAVNCAAKSCPPLVPWAYSGDRVEAQLRERMQAMVGSEAHVRVEGGRLRVSSIFDWYKDDFVSPSFKPHAPSVARYVAMHAGPELRRRIEALGPSPRVEYLDYDWSLNGR
jgi:hypothetical protein